MEKSTYTFISLFHGIAIHRASSAGKSQDPQFISHLQGAMYNRASRVRKSQDPKA